MKKSDFYYNLPQEFIAQTPIEPRDSSRMMVVDKKSGKIEHRHFYDLLDYLSSPNEQNADRLSFAMKYIKEHIQDPDLSNTKLARHIGISEVYLRKLFQARYHITPKQYILDIRIRKAKQCLVDTPFTIASISEECGFSSVYHFCHLFKQRTGKTPSQYAAENKNGQI